MSAARRKEALDRFNIPLKRNDFQPSTPASSDTKTPERRMSSRKLYKLGEVNDELDSMDTSFKGRRRTSRKSAVDEDNVLSSQEPAPKITKPSPLGAYPSSDEESEDLSREVKGLPSIVSKAVKGKGKTYVPEPPSDDNYPSADPTGASDDDEYRIDCDSDDDAETITASVRKAVKGKAVAISASQRGKMNYDAILRSYTLDDEVPVVMLISLKAGALGLQLTAANNVFLVSVRLIPLGL